MTPTGKSGSLAALVDRVQSYGYASKEELKKLLHTLVLHPAITPAGMVWALSHSDPKVRGFTARWLLREREPAIIPDLMREMHGKHPQIREGIAKLVARLGEPEKIRADVTRMLYARDLQVRAAALDLLAVCPWWSANLTLIKAALRDPEASIRQRAVRLLCRGVEERRVFLMLRELIHDRSQVVRSMVIAAMANHPQPGIVEPFFERLALEGPTERNLMITALSRLARNPRAHLEERLVPILADENPSLRQAALELLAEMPGRTRIMRTFLVYCRGLAPWLRERVQGTIEKLGGDLLDPLLELINDADVEVCASAMAMAAPFKDKRIIAPLKRIFQSDAPWWLRSLAADVLGGLPCPEVFQTLIEKLDDPEVRHGVIAILGLHREPGLAGYLLECLGDPQRDVRLATLEALRNHSQPRVIEALFHVAQRDSDALVRERAVHTLGSLLPENDPRLAKLESLRLAAARRQCLGTA